MSRRSWVRVTLGGLVALLACCGEEEEAALFSRAQALDLVDRFRSAWLRGDAGKVAALCQVPFRFQTRIWKTGKDLRNNLPVQLPRHARSLEEAEQLDVYTYRDLMQGRWPRGKRVAAESRAEEVSRLGVRFNGLVVHGYRGHRRGWLLVLNPAGLSGAPTLLVQGLLPAP